MAEDREFAKPEDGPSILADAEQSAITFTPGLADQFDAVIHMDHTRAVEPLERTAQWKGG